MKPYVPEKLPLENIDWEPLVSLIGQANRGLARYDAMLEKLPNSSLLLSALTTEEAVISSKIEGIVTTLEEVYEKEAEGEAAVRENDGIQEVVNYRLALRSAAKELEERPPTLHVVRNIHAVLMDSVRGQDKGPGSFRRKQVWIGRPGCKIEEAQYVPPETQMVTDCMENLESYFTHPEKDPVVQQAVIHAQFEMIHPFEDGNGRVGRLVIPLLLCKAGVLSAPMFYLSAYLEAHREEYYVRLQAISEHGQWQQWIEFFLSAVIEQAKENTAKAKAIFDLYDQSKIQVTDLTRSQYAIKALDAIFEQPFFTTSGFAQRLGVSRPTANNIIKKLENGGVIRKILSGRGRRAARYIFGELVLLFFD